MRNGEFDAAERSLLDRGTIAAVSGNEALPFDLVTEANMRLQILCA
jgi:hypothetical protein